MDICCDDHDEIVYEGSFCPACDIRDRCNEFEQECLDLREQVEALAEELSTAQDDLEEAQKGQ